jgi:rubredoxin
MIEQQAPKLDFRCATCGYGVARLRPPERCPMCSGSRWQQQSQRHVTADMGFATPLRLMTEAPARALGQQTTREAERWLPMPRT